MKMFRVIFTLILLIGVLAYCTGQSMTPTEEKLTYEKLSKKLDKGEDFLLVDVRTPEEYSSGHIPGAINIPLSNIVDAFPTQDKNARVVVYCKSGNRSGQAQQALREKGYVNVTDFGGIPNWKGPLKTGNDPK
ncbi:MAG: rhodanese-like domain-containing protein [Spirochaetales bacterium]|nr:rhodanese-like domain-containing protein [Spirochaetales bacterium]